MSESDAPPRRRLPDAELPPLAGGDPVPLRARRQGTVLVLLDRAPTDADRAYLRELLDAAPALADWDGRVLVVAGGDAVGAGAAFAPLGLPFPVVADPEQRVAAAAGVAAPALVVADQWGEVHAAEPAGPGGRWLPAGEVEQWLRFIAVRCGG